MNTKSKTTILGTGVAIATLLALAPMPASAQSYGSGISSGGSIIVSSGTNQSTSQGNNFNFGAGGSIIVANAGSPNSYPEVPQAARRLAGQMIWANDLRCSGWTTKQSSWIVWQTNNITTCYSPKLNVSARVQTATDGVLFSYSGVAAANRSDGFKGMSYFSRTHPNPETHVSGFGW